MSILIFLKYHFIIFQLFRPPPNVLSTAIEVDKDTNEISFYYISTKFNKIVKVSILVFEKANLNKSEVLTKFNKI